MSSTWWQQICGVAALLAAVLGIALIVAWQLAPAGVTLRTAASLGYIVAAGFLLVLLATAFTHWPYVGPLGRAGFVLALLAFTVDIVPATLSSLGGAVATLTSATSDARVTGWVVWAVEALLVVGLLLAGGASFRSHRSARWAGAVVVAIGVLLLPEVILFLPLTRHYDTPLFQSLYRFLLTYAYPVILPIAIDVLWGVAGTMLLFAPRPRATEAVAVPQTIGSTTTLPQ